MLVVAHTSGAALETFPEQDHIAVSWVNASATPLTLSRSQKHDQLTSSSDARWEQSKQLENANEEGDRPRSASDEADDIALAASMAESEVSPENDGVKSSGAVALAAPSRLASPSGDHGPPTCPVAQGEGLQESEGYSEEGDLSRSASDAADDTALVAAMGGDG